MDADFLELGRILWRRRWPVIGTALACAVLMAGVSLLMVPHYTATVTILPSSQGADSALFTQIAALSGLGVGGEVDRELLYGEVLLSDRVLDRILDRTWGFDGREGATLAAIYGVDDAEPDERPVLLKRRLRSGPVRWLRDEQTGFMVLRATAPRDPAFAASLANALADELDAVIGGLEISRARDTRVFVETQLAVADSLLKAAEDELRAFVEANRAYAASPVLTQTFGTLQREVEAQSLVWGELKRQFEIARIEEQRSSLSVEVLDRAAPPLKPTSPRRRLMVMLGFVVGLLAAGLVVSVAHALGSGRRGHGA